MTVLPDELILGIIRHLERESLKASRNVCRQWYRVATQLLFQHVPIYDLESLECLKRILSQSHLSRSIKTISFEPTDGDEVTAISLIVQPDMPWIFQLPPTSCYIHYYQTNCATRLAGFNSNCKGELTLLEEICILTSGKPIPYLTTAAFKNVRQLHIKADSVELSNRITLPLLEEFHITSYSVDDGLLIDFIHRHRKLWQLYLTLEIRLGPLQEAHIFSMKCILQTKLSDELVTSIIRNAERDALGVMRIMVKSIHRQITEMLDEELVKELSQEFVTVFREWKEFHYNEKGSMWEDVQSAIQSPGARTVFLMAYQEGELPAFEA